MDSVVQAVLAIDEICEVIGRPLARIQTRLPSGEVEIESDEKYYLRENLRRELFYITQPTKQSEGGPAVSLNQIGIWMDQERAHAKPMSVGLNGTDLNKPRTADLRRLRDAVFAVKRPEHVDIHGEYVPDFVAEVNLERQFDACQVLELFMDALLPYRHRHESLLRPTALPGLEFYKATPELQTTLQISLYPPKGIQDWMVETGRRTAENRNVQASAADQQAYREYFEQQSQLVEQIRHYSRGQTMPEARFNPRATMLEDRMEARVTEAETGAVSQNQPETRSPYLELNFLCDLPEILPIQLKRFTNNGNLLNPLTRVGMGIAMPRDGIIDLSEFVAAGQRQDDQSILYRIVSYVEHIPALGAPQSINGGHYVAYANRNGNYWRLDDSAEVNRIVSETEFFGHRNPYLIILKKLTPEEIAARAEAADPTND